MPKIFLAGVGEMMTEVAGEVCDGFICHGFTTERYLREVTLPALARGRAKAGKSMEGFEIVGPSFVVTGNDEAEMTAAESGTRQQIAFYGSTPAYKGVLELHGWNGLHEELNALSKKGGWVEMGNLIDDEILNTFAVVAEPEQIAPELLRRYGDVDPAHQLLRPVQDEPRPLAPSPRRPPSCVTNPRRVFRAMTGLHETLVGTAGPETLDLARRARGTLRGRARGIWRVAACRMKSSAACPA